MTMPTLSPRGRALVSAGRRALQPTETDRARLLSALSFRLRPLPCRPAWVRCRPHPLRTASRRRGRALPAGRNR